MSFEFNKTKDGIEFGLCCSFKAALWFIAAVCFLCWVCSCSRLYLPANATGAEKQAADCKDAKAWVNSAEKALTAPGSTLAASWYWSTGLTTARTFVETYCKD